MSDLIRLSLVLSDDPVLRKIAEPVTDIKEQVLPHVGEMAQLLVANEGLGLAAPQVGISFRFFLAFPEIEIFINPILLRHGKETTVEEEGCLSFPGQRKMVKRWRVIDVEYQNLVGQTIRKTLKGDKARVWLHEYDHLEGKIIF